MTKLTISAAVALLGATVLFGAAASAAPLAGPSPVLSSPDGMVLNAQMTDERMTRKEKMMKKKMMKKKMMKKKMMKNRDGMM